MRDTETKLRNTMAERVLLLDGAMGTMIQAYDLDEQTFRGRWVCRASRGFEGVQRAFVPDATGYMIADIHRRFLDAGADIIETNTFNATAISMAEYQLQDRVHDLNVVAANIAREVADEVTKQNPHKPRFVAGALGPTSCTLSLSPDVNDPAFRTHGFDEGGAGVLRAGPRG